MSNGKCTKSVSALLHWKTLFTLGKHAGCIDQLQKVTKHNYELNTFPAANFIDSHFHLDKLTQRSSIKSLDGIILSCRQYSSNNIKYVLESAIANYCFPRSWPSNVDFRKIINEESKVYFTVGIHPRCCTSIQEDDLVNLENNLVSWGRVVPLGEVGIDYTGGYSLAECEAQHTALRSMLPLAVRLDLPVMVHVRDVGISRLASQHFLEILRECLPESHVIHRHCFTGGMSELNE